MESEDSNLGWSSLHLIFEVNKMKSLLNSSAQAAGVLGSNTCL